MPDSTDRRFDEREVALILQETAALQERADRAGDARPESALLPARTRGLTLTQLEQIAGEAGLDVALVRRAAASVDARRTLPRGNRFLGAPHVIDIERTVEGEVTAGAHEALLEAVRRATGELGEVTSFGRQFGWKGKVEGKKTQIAVSPVGGRTVVRVRVQLEEEALGIFMLSGVMGGGVGGILSGSIAATLLGPVGALAGAAVLGTGYVTARTLFKRVEARLRAGAEEIADEVAAAAEQVDRLTG
jgi:hypothetical protein